MSRWLLAAVLVTACSKKPEPADTRWVSGIKPWYCGAEQVEGKETPDGTRASRSRDLALKLAPNKASFSGTYALENAGEKYVGTLTHFKPVGERSGTLQWENDHRQKGEATLTFSEDFQTLTVNWQVGAEASSGSSKLTAATDPSACPAAKEIR